MEAPNILLQGKQTIKERLGNAPAWVLIFYVSITAFSVYACMYGFRKPFTAASFEDITFLGLPYKTVLVISQTIGYMLSKFIGIKFIAGMQPQKRAANIIKLIITAWLSLLLFGVVPAPYNFIFMFINGLPLGMIWGLVFGFVEGRRTTELMGAVLATSFIFASGLAKTVGKWLVVELHVSDFWMPFAAGGVFIAPLLISTWLLGKTPAPTADDIAHRSVRKPMTKDERVTFIKHFGMALIPIILAYIMLTILRDFSEDFANELWSETGYKKSPGIFAQTSTIISMVILAVIGGFFLIKNNYKAFQLNHIIIIVGFSLAAGATFMYHQHYISPLIWIVCASSGLYLGYVPYNCFYFERMLAAYKVPGNVGFVMYIADAFGYMGTVVVLLVKEMVHFKYSWVDFFTMLFYTAAAGGILLTFVSTGLFAKLYKKK
jgi:Family of unknown function (DUF5690)